MRRPGHARNIRLGNTEGPSRKNRRQKDVSPTAILLKRPKGRGKMGKDCLINISRAKRRGGAHSKVHSPTSTGKKVGRKGGKKRSLTTQGEKGSWTHTAKSGEEQENVERW